MNDTSRLSKSLLVLLLLASVVAFAQQAPAPAQNSGIQPSYIDHAVKPGDNFYQFALGEWLKKTEIPPDRGGVSVATGLVDQANKRIAGIIEEAAKSNPAAGSNNQKIADLYKSYMDEATLEKRGLDAIKPHLQAIANIKDKKQLSHALGETLRQDVDALNNTNFHTPNLFGFWVAPGFDDSAHYVPYLLQGGLQLPDREYYLSDSAHMKEVRDKYKAHIATMLKLAGFDNTDARAENIINLEHAIAEKHISLADNNDIHKANNTWKMSDFATKAPGLDWPEYFKGAGLDKQPSFMVWQPTAFAGESALVASQPLDTWKDYLAFHLIEAYAGGLPKAFSDERFAFFGTALSGVSKQRPREIRAINLVNNNLGDAVGQIYAQRYFPPEAKAKAQEMVANIIVAFEKRIDSLDWMAPSTKTEAKAKLKTLYVGVGYPETWRDYSAYEVKPDDLFGNLWRAGLFDYRYWIGKIGKPVDKHWWSMTPQTVNAVNLPLQNALNFPAAILDSPFFDPNAPTAFNYGAIGSVIGHEISHTFDSEGSAFDSQGRVRNWWTPEDFKHFEASTAKLVAQYDAYKPFPDLSLNGKQTLAENIADVAGLAAAYDGYKASLKGQAAPEQAGFTGDQQFFIAFAQSWGGKVRDAALRQQVATDTHSPGEFRALTVRNIDAWYPAFDVKSGQTLYLAPPNRVRIW